jgi:CRP/FNR family transcriptional regulator, cyclic AMP receptor protein
MELKLQDDAPVFTRPAHSALYQPAVALEFFKSAGVTERIEQGKPLFVEADKTGGMLAGSDRIFLLLEGEVTLSIRNTVIAVLAKGEIFGEMAPINLLPRSATAVAKTGCSVISLDQKQFQNAVEKSPEFALMLMNIIIGRLRETISGLTSGGRLSDKDRWNRATVFDRKLLADLEHELEDKPATSHPANKVIMKEGDKGMFMYVVVEGVVAVSIDGRTLEKIGPGGVFGEMALVSQAPRAATATSETDCTLLAINRTDFMNLVKIKPAFGMNLLRALSERLRFMTAKYK